MCDCEGENLKSRDKNPYSGCAEREGEGGQHIRQRKRVRKSREREGQFGLRISVKGTRHEETNK